MNNQLFFKNRLQAGIRLATLLKKLSILDPIILGLPRGRLIVAKEVAKLMNAPLDVIVSRKIGHPRHSEFAIGAVCEDEIPLFNPESVKHVSHTSEAVLDVVSQQRMELRRRVDLYRHGRNLISLKNRNVIVVDDGIATGATASAAGKYLKIFEPKKLMLAVPVGPINLNQMTIDQFDEIFCLEHVKDFNGVGMHYEDFSQTTDFEVCEILDEFHPQTRWRKNDVKQERYL